MHRKARDPRQVWLPLILIVAAGATNTAIPSVSAETGPQTTQKTNIADSDVTGDRERFDGYLFLDADGRPLPFQSNDEIEDYLRSAEVESLQKIPVGVTSPRKALLNRENLRVHAVFKYVDEKKRMVRDHTATGQAKLYLNWRDSYVYDVAAYHVDRLLHLDRVPPIVLRKVKRRDGSLQIWLEGTITEADRRKEGFEPSDIARYNQQVATMHLFNNLVDNRDANLGNWLIDRNWRLWFIDCTRCFGESKDLLYPEAITHCDRAMWKALKELSREGVEQSLSPYLSRGEIDALLERRDKLVDHLQARIDELGEELVLFDQRPPTETAPWVGE